MRTYYDFSKGKKNPYSRILKKQITIRLDPRTIAYFKGMAKEVGMPYQSLINMYLMDCAEHKRKLRLQWQG
jgi:predicted DNA binding CopG/RHH family protein